MTRTPTAGCPTTGAVEEGHEADDAGPAPHRTCRSPNPPASERTCPPRPGSTGVPETACPTPRSCNPHRRSPLMQTRRQYVGQKVGDRYFLRRRPPQHRACAGAPVATRTAVRGAGKGGPHLAAFSSAGRHGRRRRRGEPDDGMVELAGSNSASAASRTTARPLRPHRRQSGPEGSSPGRAASRSPLPAAARNRRISRARSRCVRRARSGSTIQPEHAAGPARRSQ